MSSNKDEKPFLSWKKFFDLYTKGKDISEEEIVTIKKEYKKRYHKRYQRRWNTEVKRINVRFNFKDYDLLLKAMEVEDEKKVGKYIVSIVRHHLGVKNLVRHKRRLDDLSYLVRKCSNNINQVVQKIHAEAKFRRFGRGLEEKELYELALSNYSALVAQVAELEVLIGKTTEHPTLSETLFEMFDGDEVKVEYALASIEHFKTME